MNTHFRWTALLLMGLASGLAGCGGGGSGGCSSLATGSVGSLLCGSASNNRAPVAAVSAPSSATVGTALTLDGTGSSDPDGQSVTFRWEITAKPAGSLAALSDSTAARPVFTPDVVGTYTVRLIVNDGRSDSAPVTFSTSARRLNNAPVAHAGDDVTAVNGTEVFLNGLASSDPDGDPIEDAGDRLFDDVLRHLRVRIGVPDHAQHLAFAQGHAHQGTGRKRRLTSVTQGPADPAVRGGGDHDRQAVRHGGLSLAADSQESRRSRA